MRLESLFQDVRFAWRTLQKDWGFTAILVATLALGIAANTTIFSLINPYLFRPLPFDEADRLLQLEQVDPINEWPHARLSPPQYLDWKERSRAFEDMAGYYYGTANVTGDAGPERIGVGYLTDNMFRVLGASPVIGRALVEGEDGPGGADVVVLGHGLWQRRYSGDPEIVGRTITLDGTVHTVVGVMPPEFNFPFGGIKMWVPTRRDLRSVDRERNYMLVIGRLADGWSVERARAELTRIQAQLAEEYPEADGVFSGVTIRPLREALNFAYDILRVGFLVLLLAVSAVLMIACVNVASLTLARASGRAREVAVRSALGAGRGRLVRQLLTESTLLALLGGALGVLLTVWAAGLIGPVLPEDLYRVGEMSVDWRVLGFALAITLATPLLFGLAPAITATRTNLTAALKEGGRGGSGGRGTVRGRRVLVVLEVTMAIVLIVGAGLMIRSLVELQEVDLGFQADRILTVEVTPPESDYESPERAAAYFERATTGLAGTPGVRAASTIYPLPLNHELSQVQYLPSGTEPAGPDDWPIALLLYAAPGLFDAMGIPVVAGRTFDRGDVKGAPNVVIVSRKLAQRHWPGGSPVGRTLSVGGPGSHEPMTVVGVVGDIKHAGIADENRVQLWRPLGQVPLRRRFIVLQAAGSIASIAPSVRQTLLDIDPNLPVTIRPMTAVVQENTLQWAMPSAFLGVFGLVALLLAALGIYGVIAYSVARRRREMGIRMALGATARQVRSLVLSEGLKLTGIGIGIGIALALVVGQLMSSQLFGVDPFDPVTLLSVIGLFGTVAAAASFIPARRAARADPQEALRAER